MPAPPLPWLGSVHSTRPRQCTRGKAGTRWSSRPASAAPERTKQPAASTKFALTLFPSPPLPLLHRHTMVTSTSSLPRIGQPCPAAGGGGTPLRSLALVSLLLASLPAPTAGASSSPSSLPHRRELISKDAALSKAACFGSYPRYVLCVCWYLLDSAGPGLCFPSSKGRRSRK